MKAIMKMNKNNAPLMTMSEADCTKITDKFPDRFKERENVRVEIENKADFKSKLKVLNKTNTQYLYISCLHYSHSEKF